jgi:Fe-S oxidoreductase
MAMKPLTSYKKFLDGCRFCLLCKPVAEVANVTHIESYTTKARAMILWRVASKIAEFTPRDVELIYQGTLDSISQAWCVNHYPVSEYMVASRAEIYSKGLAPKSVQDALKQDVLRNSELEPIKVSGDVILLASEACELGERDLILPALRVLKKAGISAEPALIQSGALAYSLGDFEKALAQAKQVLDMIKNSGVNKVLVDGPKTLCAVRYIYPLLGVTLPQNIEVTSLSEEISTAVKQGTLKNNSYAGKKIIFHDSRSACHVADEMSQDQAILPDFQGPETVLGKGEVYEAPRRILDALGIKRIFSVWSRSLSKSCGVDDGLSITYPELAKELAQQSLQEAEKLGAEMIITDSLLCACHLKSIRHVNSIEIRWILDIFE